MITHTDDGGVILIQYWTEVPLKYVKYNHNGAMASFLPGLGSVLQAVESPLKATERLRWEEALPAEGSTIPKCQHHSAVINRQWWQPQSCSPAQLLPHDKTCGQETLGNINCPYHFHFLKGSGGVCVWRRGGGGVLGWVCRYKTTVGAQARRATVHKPWLCTFHLGGDLERFQTTETS